MDITRFLKQTVTYWSESSRDKWNTVTYSTPVKITGRWEDKQELFIDSNGIEARSNAIVYLNQDISLKGYLYLGKSTETNPTDVSGAKEIRGFAKIPSMNAEIFLRKVWL